MAKRKAKTPRIEGMTWVGDGTEFIPNVPPRDLDPDEAGLYRDLILATQENTGRVLYEMQMAEPDPDEDAPNVDQSDSEKDE